MRSVGVAASALIGHALAWAAGAYLVFEPFYGDVLRVGACILSILTIGVFYLAAALALLVAAIGDLWPSRARG